MSTSGLPTIWELVAEGAATLPEPFTRAALINWVSARRPDVGVSSIATHIQLATGNAGSPPSGRAPLLHRVDRGRYVRHREVRTRAGVVLGTRLVLIGSSGGRRPSRCRSRGSSPAPASPGPATLRSAPASRGSCSAPRTACSTPTTSSARSTPDRRPVHRLPHGLGRVGGGAAGRAGPPGRRHGRGARRRRLRPATAPAAHRRGATLEIPLPGAWQESDDEVRSRDGDAGEAPVRIALGRLRDLVVRHRAS
ncbi:hypothetical protein U6N30_19030 [Blastococcus brunescens]|uniref:DUF7669 domain-containing protein n=1 Tax=Blastococcus brunescens TaxID=1564165 RepID=A0ABZ1AXK7_9ACTN|nr:hypothetical protein [Blastococcus sp. BMG 8361]WRL62138.1 hypothetical protein U6N30_19030 [Blastococcus sp. BMG 8361]